MRAYGHRQAEFRNLDVQMPAKGKGKEKGLYDSGVGEEYETEDRDHREKEKYEQHGEGAARRGSSTAREHLTVRGGFVRWMRCVGGEELVCCKFHF